MMMGESMLLVDDLRINTLKMMLVQVIHVREYGRTCLLGICFGVMI
jgi:hypothetical protein